MHSVETPIVSIGSITIGGAGKTPLTAKIAQLLISQNKKIAILSRGYGRNTKGLLILDRDLPSFEATGLYGDEPVLLSLLIPEIPIIVSENRYKGAKYIENTFHPDIILLDDGFQHRRLKHTFDILIFKKDFRGFSERYFPFGTLRDSLSRLKSANHILLESGTDKHIVEDIKSFSKVSLFHFDYSISGSENIEDSVTAFCGIAKPGHFFETLDSLGILCTHKKSFRDHIHYSDVIIDELTQLKSSIYICTQKDYVKLPKNFLDTHTIRTVDMILHLDDEQGLLELLLKI